MRFSIVIYYMYLNLASYYFIINSRIKYGGGQYQAFDITTRDRGLRSVLCSCTRFLHFLYLT